MASTKRTPLKTSSRTTRGRPSGEPEAVGRDTLLAAAARVLRRMPPSAVTRLAIATEAQVDPNLIRYYFGTVEQLISEVVLATHQTIFDRLEKRAVTEPVEWLRVRTEELLSMFLGNPYHHELLLKVMYADTSSDEHAAWRRSLDKTIAYMSEQLDKGVAQERFRPVDPRFLNLAMLGMTEFFANNAEIIRDMFGEDVTPERLSGDYAAFVVDLLLNGLRARD